MDKPKDFNPPTFAPDAVPSNRGWVNKKDGKLIVPNSGLLNRINAWNALNPPEKNNSVPVAEKQEEEFEAVDAGIEIPPVTTKKSKRKNLKEKKESK